MGSSWLIPMTTHGRLDALSLEPVCSASGPYKSDLANDAVTESCPLTHQHPHSAHHCYRLGKGLLQNEGQCKREKTAGGKGIEAQQECKKSLRQEQIKLDKTSIAAEGCSRCLVDIIPLCRQALQTAGAAQSPSPNLLQHQVPEALLGTGLKVHLQVLAAWSHEKKKSALVTA